MSDIDKDTTVQCKALVPLSSLPEDSRNKICEYYGLNKDETHMIFITEDDRFILLKNVIPTNVKEDVDGERDLSTFRSMNVNVIDNDIHRRMLDNWKSWIESQSE